MLLDDVTKIRSPKAQKVVYLLLGNKNFVEQVAISNTLKKVIVLFRKVYEKVTFSQNFKKYLTLRSEHAGKSQS